MMVMTTILAAAAAALALARWLKLPAIPLLVIAGVVLHALGVLVDMDMIYNAMILGLTFLVFVMGTELNPARVGTQRVAALSVGLLQFAIVGTIGFLVVRALGYAWVTALHLALAVTASSTLVVVNLLRQRQQFFEPFGRLVLGVLLLQDVLIILAIAALNRVHDGPLVMGGAVVMTLALMGLSWVCVRWVTPYMLLKVNRDEEGLLLAVLTILFLFVGVAHWLDLPWVVGAFLAGVALSGFPTQGVVRGQLSSLADFFMAVFFVSLGAILTLPSPDELRLAVVLTAMVLLVTPMLVTIIGRRIGMTARTSIESGLLIAQCSEFSLILALIGQEQGYLDERMLGVIALVTVVTMIITPFVATDHMTWRIMRWELPGTPRRHKPREIKDHILMLGCGTNGMKLLNRLVPLDQPIIVVDDDPAVVAQVQSRQVEAVRGDGADDDILQSVNASAARVIISNMRRLEDNLRLLRIVRGPKVLVRVFDPESAQRISELGGTPIEEARAATDALVQWFADDFVPRRAAGQD